MKQSLNALSLTDSSASDFRTSRCSRSVHHRLLTAMLFVVAWTIVNSAAWSAEHSDQRPNIILVFIDDMGWGDFSCFGNTSVKTQNFDQLAAEGIRFEQFYVNSPICSPSRVAISTGQYPQRWKITSFLNNRQNNIDRGMAQWLDPAAPMLARLLHDAGYATGHFGKWHMGGQRDVGEAPLITEYGFDKSLTNFEGLGPRVLGFKNAYNGKPAPPHTLGSDNLGRGEIRYVDRSVVTQEFTNAALDFIKQAESEDRPFYVNLWPDDVHSPFFPPKARRGDQTKRSLYHGVLDTADEQIGELLSYVRDSKKLREQTIILACSDNGPEEGAGSAGHLRGFKTHLFEGGIRSPLIVWAPGYMQPDRMGSTNQTSYFAAIDLVPSLLALASVAVPDRIRFDGQALPDVLMGRSTESRSEPLFFRRPPDRDNFYGVKDLPDLAVRLGEWKLLCEYDGSDAMLFHVNDDPSEEKDLAAVEPERVAQLTQLVLEWHGKMPPDNGATYAQSPQPKGKQ
ncbi:MAG: sulfatase-like hydrolase/transferase [Planctomycetaceae bacterium]|nr:sulfatase-like hydrolase/transferase [Planctomycetaceae bacterium]